MIALNTRMWVVSVALLSLMTSGAGARHVAPPPPNSPHNLIPFDSSVGQPAQPEDLAPAANIVPWARLVFQSFRDNNWEVYRANPDGSGVTRLTNNPASDIDPRLNRGATRIVFASNRAGGDFDILAMNADGSGMAALTNDSSDDLAPVWSPDGARIAFESYRHGASNGEVYLMNANGSSQTRLTNSPGYDGAPTWSPDGGKIAFVSRRDGRYRVWVMNADGTNPQPRSNQINAFDPAWSPDGSAIAYDSDIDGDGWEELWLMNADGGNQRMVYNPSGDVVAWARSWSPDGRYVAFSEIAMRYYQGNLYWTSGRARVWDSVTGSVQDLTPGQVEWKPDLASSDASAPTSNVQALPGQSPGPFTVRWTGADSGGAGLKSFDVQVKEGNGGWSAWKSGVAETSASYPGIGGRTYSFRSRARDNAFNTEAWPAGPDATTTVENQPPQTAVTPLPAFSRNGLTVSWGGADPGGSGIKSYDVQTRSNNGAWTDWMMDTADTQASYTGALGAVVQFRVRARDHAQNLETWPASADAATTLYSWGVNGVATDNRGAPVAAMSATTSPPAIQPATSDGDGHYAAFVAPAAASYSVAWSKTGYLSLPATTFAPLVQDTVVDVVLPPADNSIVDGGFESGSLGPAWQATGSPVPAATADTRHTGQYGARLQATTSRDAPVAAVTIAQQTTIAAGLTTPTLSFAYRLLNPSPASGDRLAVEIDAASGTTVVFSRSASIDAWTYQWIDLTPWSGQTVAVRFRLDRVSAGSSAAHLDEISVGSAHPDLWVQAPGAAARPGQQLVYTLGHGNRGGVEAEDVTLTLQLPPHLAFVSADPPPSATTPALRWDLASAPPFSGQTIALTLQLSAAAAAGSTLNIPVSIAATTAELETGNNTAAGHLLVGSRTWLPLVLK